MSSINEILLPIEEYDGENYHFDTDLTCSICRSLLENPTIIRGCGHVFCKDCIYEWFNEQKCCPICQKKYEIYNNDYIQIDDIGMLIDILGNLRGFL